MELVAGWFVGVTSITAALVGWYHRHAHLDEQPVGPLDRHFRVVRASVVLWLVVVACFSGVYWGLPLLPAWHRLAAMGVLLLGMLALIPVWNWQLRRRAGSSRSGDKK